MTYTKQIIFKSTFEEVERLEGFLNQLQKDLSFNDELYAKLMLVVSEAVTNGIVHGNNQDASKKVYLDVSADSSKLQFTIKDEGDGFEPDDVPDPLAEENLLKASGRGVFLMEEFADQVEYSDNGTTLKLEFSLAS